ncbi:thioesterase superfamily protein [Ferrimonas balearica DSM 9799]|uniref:Medium/long-chain acyl-CoA thioesterase YigI n=1 Tax=Ferrimonas balearica (strain DSM 9799 / CCM 4581 / KCTC 23876 / PAT) TaxID=550540 RepID=E1SQB1_FERBD|nr:thioesterase family protein [Ferrimonas balearica]ADN77882.1 thioesterase superfamily protein [Ferrimonas balearica DSM 9799]MBW3141421.1 thioesterase family protein [Ferrimonas balearica]MBW3166413.1 thioesterase family protein [Ferrimonas balearica]MBY6108465.1 thioesterase family protein [Ferrimonas balearica]
MTSQLILDKVSAIFSEQLPFHRHLGLKVVRYDTEGVEVAIDMADHLIGNVHQQILHGGVTATLLDVTGGLTAFAGVVAREVDPGIELLQQKLPKLGTIDLRVDYLRPGRGQRFIATGTIIRTGNKVAVCRMELHNEEGSHIAFGTGTYLVG